MNDMIETTMQTPIEIALGIDENGMTTAKKLFDFLGMAKNNYSRWFRNNLINNEFAEENIDYFPFFPNEEKLNGRSSQERSEKYQPNPSPDARLTASFAKKLSMMAKSEKGEQARKYFVKVEDGMKELAVRFQNMSPELRAVLVVDQRVTKVEKKTDTLEARFNDFEQGLPLLPEDADNISKEVKKRVVELLGGKESNAYHNKSLCQKVFMDAYRNLKGNFDVSSYKAIKRNRKEIAVQIAREYKPPLYLVEQIEEENSQIRFL